MGQLVVAVTLLCLALLVGVGFWLEVGSGLLNPDSPMDVGSDTGLPSDGQDGNVVVTLGKGKKFNTPPLDPLDVEDWKTGARLTKEEKSQVDQQGYLPYIVQKGDTLSSLSQRYLGTATLWSQIMTHNRVKLMRPQDLREGMELRIPLWLKKDF